VDIGIYTPKNYAVYEGPYARNLSSAAGNPNKEPNITSIGKHWFADRRDVWFFVGVSS